MTRYQDDDDHLYSWKSSSLAWGSCWNPKCFSLFIILHPSYTFFSTNTLLIYYGVYNGSVLIQFVKKEKQKIKSKNSLMFDDQIWYTLDRNDINITELCQKNCKKTKFIMYIFLWKKRPGKTKKNPFSIDKMNEWNKFL